VSPTEGLSFEPKSVLLLQGSKTQKIVFALNKGFYRFDS